MLEQFNLEEEEYVGIDERGPELIDTQKLAAIDELKRGKAFLLVSFLPFY